jgi:hypothetical protein
MSEQQSLTDAQAKRIKIVQYVGFAIMIIIFALIGIMIGTPR